MVPAALALARELLAAGGAPVLLHGDLMDKNLLWGKPGLVAIDPMPMIGDAHSDLGFWAATHPPAGRLRHRALEIASRTGRDPERAARWTAVWAVGKACDGPPGHVRGLREWLRGEEAMRDLTMRAERTL